MIVKQTGSDPDYADTMLKYYGKAAYYATLIAPGFLILGAVTVYFVIMSSLLYPITLCIYTWCSGNVVEPLTNPTFAHYSSSYTSLLLFAILVLICSKKDLGIFLRIGSFGVAFIIFLMVFIIATGIIAFGDTTFMIGAASD